MTQIVPLQPVPRQNLQVQLENQPIALTIYQTDYGLFVDVYLANSPVILGVIAQNRNLIVRSRYLGVAGDFAFYDTEGDADPVYDLLGTRYQLLYLSEAELLGAGGA